MTPVDVCHNPLCKTAVAGTDAAGSPMFAASPRQVSLPFAHLNLRKNPFGEFTAKEIAALAHVDIDDVVMKLSNPRFAVQYVGEQGFGKTTHLLAIHACYPAAGYVHIPEGERAEIPAGCPVLIDEAQRLTWRQRRQLFRADVPLVLGTHRDFRRALRRAGRIVETVSVERRMDAARLCELLNARIRWVRRGGGPLPRIREESARRMLQQFGPNVRQILHALYITFQDLSRIQDV